ncbi:MAG TPA: M23 family metallopeptidase [Longimicrobiales bacterium]|nr:M23 family metallopeptidase [Longimicrobiales bacterium]
MTHRLAAPLCALVLAVAACETVEQVMDHYRDLTPHEAYVQSLRDAGLEGTALVRDWLEAGRRAVQSPLPVDLPFREEGFIAPDEAGAVGYRFAVERGQALTVRLSVESDDSARVFLDLFRIPTDSTGALRPVTTADTLADGLVYEPWRDGEYVVRVQPELLRGGHYVLTLTLDAALGFPVEGRDAGAIQSFFGAERDGGVRSHHGVDIFAPRGTPALAAAEGVIRRVRVTTLGGKVVWIRDARRNESLYYAHLDSQAVGSGDRVQVGDTVGFIGNTGNARTTLPHLHFGIYRRGEGPVDPLPFIRKPPGELAELTADARVLGSWARVPAGGIHLRRSPTTRSDVVARLDRFVPFRVLGGSAAWFRVRLPDGQVGWVAARLAEPVDGPVRSTVAAARATIQARPAPTAPVVEPVEAGASLPVLGEFGGYLLVEGPGGRRG